MDGSAIHERVEQVISVRADSDCVLSEVEFALGRIRQLRSWLAACEADLAGRVAAAVSFPEATLAEASRESTRAASDTLDRSATLRPTPRLAAALDAAAITPGHVDAVTRAAKTLEAGQRDELFGRVDSLADVAAASTVAEFAKRVRAEAKRISSADGEDRLDRQRRATSMSTWVDPEGMWNVRGRFDPVSGLTLDAALQATVEAKFAEATPDTCPCDPVEKQKHLRALAFAALVHGTGSRPAGRPEFVAVIDVSAGHGGGSGVDSTVDSAGDSAVSTPNVAGQPTRMTWPIPIEVPQRVLAEMLVDHPVESVLVRDGVVHHAPGRLNLGRSTRLANRAQRRALRGLYSTCAIPGCDTHFDRCKLHHVTWWRHGGTTDLDNLLPICVRHHSRVHDAGWVVALGRQRELTITFPDGTIRCTGPPSRHTT